MITIVNYGMGNLGSIQNMFKRIGAPCQITGDKEEIAKAEKVLLPGVGAFDAAVEKLRESDLLDILNKKATIEKVPVLGICLGMQLLTNSSEEGVLPGLGWIPGETIRFRFEENSRLKVPHMGWNEIRPLRNTPFIQDLPDEPRFYFVHSYFVKAKNEEDVVATTSYGVEFHSVIQHENIIGAQFHPEKSHKFGMRLFENFSRL